MGDIAAIIQSEEAILKEIRGHLSIIDSLIGTGKHRRERPRRVGYAANAITTGKRLYDTFLKYNVASVEQLKQAAPAAFKEEVFLPNIAEGQAWAEFLRGTRDYDFVVDPSTFFGDGWTQDHYYAHWERIIIDYVDDVCVDEAGEFSSGVTLEKKLALSYPGKRLLYGRERSPLSAPGAAEKIKSAIAYIEKVGADIKPLYNVYRQIKLLADSVTHDRIIVPPSLPVRS